MTFCSACMDFSFQDVLESYSKTRVYARVLINEDADWLKRMVLLDPLQM